MSVRMFAIGLTLVQTIVMTRVFGSEVFGLLSIALSVSALMVLLLSAGLDQILMRDIARIGKSRVAYSQRWQDLWRLVLLWVVPLTLVVASLGVLLISLTNIGGPYQLTLIAAFLLLPIILSRKFIESICLGTKQVVRSITGSQIVYPILMILGGASIWLLGIDSDAQSVALTYAFAGVGSLIASSLLIAGALREMSAKTTVIDKESSENTDLLQSPGDKAILMSGVHFSLVSLGFVLSQHIDVLLMGVLSTPENVALVRIAARVAEMAGLMRAIIVLQYRPILSEAYGKKNLEVIEEHVSFMLKVFITTGLPIVIGTCVFAEEIMLVFGDEFEVGANALRIYIIGVFLTLLAGPGDVVLSQTGFESYASKTLMISLCVQILLGLILIPIWGVEGCATANLCALATTAILMRFNTKKHTGIEPSVVRLFSK
jgi:O-antigen/teichoic acid export membrane protein